VIGGIQPVLPDGVEEPGCLRRCPHREGRANAGAPPFANPLLGPDHGFRSPRGRQLGPGGSVSGDMAGADGSVQRCSQRRLDTDQRRGRHGPAHGLVLAVDRGEHRLHMRRRQVSQQDLPEARRQVQAHVRGVTAQGRASGRGPAHEPALQPLPNGQRRNVRVARGRHTKPRQRHLRVLPAGEAAAADAAAAPVERGQVPWRGVRRLRRDPLFRVRR
jgi:hypothetical protein